MAQRGQTQAKQARALPLMLFRATQSARRRVPLTGTCSVLTSVVPIISPSPMELAASRCSAKSLTKIPALNRRPLGLRSPHLLICCLIKDKVTFFFLFSYRIHRRTSLLSLLLKSTLHVMPSDGSRAAIKSFRYEMEILQRRGWKRWMKKEGWDSGVASPGCLS